MTNQYGKEPERCDQKFQKLLSADQAAQALSCTVKTIHRKVRAGELGCVQISEKKRVFTAEQIENYIEFKTVEPLIDRKNPVRVSSEPRKGGEESFGESRADLLKEIRSWQ